MLICICPATCGEKRTQSSRPWQLRERTWRRNSSSFEPQPARSVSLCMAAYYSACIAAPQTRLSGHYCCDCACEREENQVSNACLSGFLKLFCDSGEKMRFCVSAAFLNRSWLLVSEKPFPEQRCCISHLLTLFLCLSRRF